MEWIADPLIWAGLVTLIVIELTLGIDNLVLIAIFAEKLPPAQRDKARITGLPLAVVTCLLLLVSIFWLVTLITSLLSIRDPSFNAHDLIMLFGGLLPLFKATMELNERLEGKDSDNPTQRKGAKFWGVVAQIVMLNAISPLDSVITAVGTVDHLVVTMVTVIIVTSLMLPASKSPTRFINSHPTIVILCLSFLLMIGFSLVVEGFGFHIPKDYLYAVIGFSVMIEALNQLAIFNRRRFLSINHTLRQRIAEAVMQLLSGQKGDAELDAETAAMLADHHEGQIFASQERRMAERVLNFSQRTVSSIMTSRHDIEHIDLNAPETEIHASLEKNQYTRLVVTGEDEQEELLGVVHVIDLPRQSLCGEPLDLRVLTRQPLVFPEALPLFLVLEQFRNARTHFAFVADEFGPAEGIVMLSDVMETIVGSLPSEVEEIDARYDIQKNADGSWTANGHMSLEDLVQYAPILLDEKREYHTIAGLLTEYLQRTPKTGEEVQAGDYRSKALQVENHRAQKVQLIPLHGEEEMDYEAQVTSRMGR